VDELIKEIENFCQTHTIDHRFVGGVSYVGWLNTTTTWKIDCKQKTVTLFDPQTPELRRKDKSYRDIDIIVLNDVPEATRKLKLFTKKLAKNPVSIESILSSSKKRRLIPQFNTALIKNTHGGLFFTLDKVQQEISMQSLEKWTLIIPNKLSLSVRHPFADFLAYHFRTASGVKPKDRQKIQTLKKLAFDSIEEGKKLGIEYTGPEYYGPWLDYITRLRHTKGKIRLKATATNLYWHTIGPRLAHGSVPIIGKSIATLGNKFTGGKQI